MNTPVTAKTTAPQLFRDRREAGRASPSCCPVSAITTTSSSSAWPAVEFRSPSRSPHRFDCRWTCSSCANWDCPGTKSSPSGQSQPADASCSTTTWCEPAESPKNSCGPWSNERPARSRSERGCTEGLVRRWRSQARPSSSSMTDWRPEQHACSGECATRTRAGRDHHRGPGGPRIHLSRTRRCGRRSRLCLHANTVRSRRPVIPDLPAGARRRGPNPTVHTHHHALRTSTRTNPGGSRRAIGDRVQIRCPAGCSAGRLHRRRGIRTHRRELSRHRRVL